MWEYVIRANVWRVIQLRTFLYQETHTHTYICTQAHINTHKYSDTSLKYTSMDIAIVMAASHNAKFHHYFGLCTQVLWLWVKSKQNQFK